jgi:hypothetical protein
MTLPFIPSPKPTSQTEFLSLHRSLTNPPPSTEAERHSLEFWSSLDPSDRDNFPEIEQIFLTAPSSLSLDEVHFMFQVLRHGHARGRQIPFDHFLATFAWIDNRDIFWEALEVISCVLKDQPDFGFRFVTEGEVRVDQFLSLFESPVTFRAWAKTAAENLIDSCRKSCSELTDFFSHFVKVVLKGFSQEIASPAYWISIFSILSKLVMLNISVPPILQACIHAASFPTIIEANWQNSFASVINCAASILRINLQWRLETFQIFIDQCHNCVAVFDNRRIIALIPIFSFIQEMIHFGINPIATGFLPMRGIPCFQEISVAVAYLELVTAILREFPDEYRFVSQNVELIEVAVGMRERGNVEQRLSAARFCIGLIELLPGWEVIWVEREVVEEIGYLLMACGSEEMKMEFVDGLLRVMRWMSLNGVVPEIVEKLGNDEFMELFEGMVDEELREQVSELNQAVLSLG